MDTLVITNLSNADYHGDPAIGASGLKVLHHQTPAHYFARYLDPKRERKEPTPAMKIGTAWHCLTFEPDEFPVRYVVLPDGLDRRTKEGKALWAEIAASGREPITPDLRDQLFAMAYASGKHPKAELLRTEGGRAECSIFWTDEETGVRCKIRPDFMLPPCYVFPNGLIIDGKTCEDASPEAFAKQVWNYDYQLQAAFYSDGYQAAFGTTDTPEFWFMVQEKEAPYVPAWYSASPELIAAGRQMYRPALELLAECQDAGEWPGYSDEVLPITPPAWALKSLDGDGEVEIAYATAAE